MYIGLTLVYTGLSIFFSLPWALLLLPVVVLLITRWVIAPEETYLEQKFGEEYIRYKAKVHRWL